MCARFLVQSTRLFPRYRGAEAFRLSGIAARCDWVVLSDTKPPHIALRRVRNTDRPRHIFLSLRAPTLAVPHFIRRVLPTLTAPFVLVSGSEDATVPRQIDARWPAFGPEDRALIDRLLAHPLLIHWFAENLDTDHPAMSPLPLGLLPPDDGEEIAIPRDLVPLRDRPLRVLCAHRTREGPQWDLRRRVSALARGPWAGFCTLVEDEIEIGEFTDLLRTHAFVLCAEGGGLDPAPKSWHALLYGAVPIIRASPLLPAYRQLPVAVVPDWKPRALGPARLAGWAADPALAQDTAAARARVIERLGLDYWWGQIAARAR